MVDLGADMLTGGSAIAEFLFGDKEERRRVYHLAKTGRLPVFYLGAVVCARRSTLLKHVEDQERLSAVVEHEMGASRAA